jgi:hypothetical protein
MPHSHALREQCYVPNSSKLSFEKRNHREWICGGLIHCARSHDFAIALRRAKHAECGPHMKCSKTVLILAVIALSVALGEDVKTINGKEYKNATVSRVEADGIVIMTKGGISKVYFTELPKDVQERFHYGSSTPTGKAVTQVIDGQSFADKFAERVQKRLDEREAILQGKHTPGPAELSVIREFNFHWVFLAVIAIVAIVLFTVVWRRFQ